MSYEVLRELARSEGPAAVATVAGARGSIPRQPGTMMLFRSDGSRVGTVGGGRIEHETAETASRCLEEGISRGIEVGRIGAEDSGADSGRDGTAWVMIEHVSDRSLYAQAAAILEHGSGITLVSEALPPCQSRTGSLLRAVLDSSGRAAAGKEREAVDGLAEGNSFFLSGTGLAYNRISPEDRLLILGGGHVGRALARFASEIGFRVTVGDNRKEYAAAERFPANVETVTGEYPEIVQNFPIGESTYVVVATPSHQTDLDSVRAVMGRPYRYAGFVGSRRKTRMILDRLVREGFDRGEAEALRAPIGADIGAETPGEIAVSILAEIIAARRNSPALASLDAERPLRRI